jgi:hypothetical protein
LKRLQVQTTLCWIACSTTDASTGHHLFSYSDHHVRSVDKSQREKSYFKERKKKRMIKITKT